MSRYGRKMSHRYRPDRRAIKRIPSRNAVASTIVGYIAFGITTFAFALFSEALISILSMFLSNPEKLPADLVYLGSMCKTFPPITFLQCLFFRLQLWYATREAIADAQFMDEIFEELYEDAKKSVGEELPSGDERWNDTANLSDDYADAAHMLIKFLIRKRKQNCEGEDEGDAQKRRIILECVETLVNLPAGAGSVDSMLAMCKEYGWIMNDTQQAKSQAWWTAEKDMEKANEMERLLEQSIMIVPEAYSFMK